MPVSYSIGGAEGDRTPDLLTASLPRALYNQQFTRFTAGNANLCKPVQPPDASKTQARQGGFSGIPLPVFIITLGIAEAQIEPE